MHSLLHFHKSLAGELPFPDIPATDAERGSMQTDPAAAKHALLINALLLIFIPIGSAFDQSYLIFPGIRRQMLHQEYFLP
jgi:hypothetical protein